MWLSAITYTGSSKLIIVALVEQMAWWTAVTRDTFPRLVAIVVHLLKYLNTATVPGHTLQILETGYFLIKQLQFY